MIKYGIRARRSNGEIVFYSQNSNGETMIPNGLSLAYLFNTKKEAKKKMEIYLKVKWFGLSVLPFLLSHN